MVVILVVVGLIYCGLALLLVLGLCLSARKRDEFLMPKRRDQTARSHHPKRRIYSKSS